MPYPWRSPPVSASRTCRVAGERGRCCWAGGFIFGRQYIGFRISVNPMFPARCRKVGLWVTSRNCRSSEFCNHGSMARDCAKCAELREQSASLYAEYLSGREELPMTLKNDPSYSRKRGEVKTNRPDARGPHAIVRTRQRASVNRNHAFPKLLKSQLYSKTAARTMPLRSAGETARMTGCRRIVTKSSFILDKTSD